MPRATLEPLSIRAPADSAAALPFAVSVLDRDEIHRGRSGLGLDEALVRVPGVSAQNRYNFSLDTRITVRGFGARSAFGVRGVTVLLDGVPQTLPDGQGQLSHVDVGMIERIEVVRGAAAAFYGNAAGGVVAITTGGLVGARPSYRLRGQGGSYGLRKWNLDLRAPLAAGGVSLALSRLRWDGFRVHSGADVRHAVAAIELPVQGDLSIGAQLRYSDTPRADNPGALTAAEFEADPAQASPDNVAMRAGKRVHQWQGAVRVRRAGPRSEVAAVLYGVGRSLANPLPSAFVTLDRAGAGGRLLARRALAGGSLAPQLRAGLEVQRQHDLRRNYDNDGGRAGDTARVDQRETVTSLGARAALHLWAARRIQVTAGARLDRVAFRVRDLRLEDGDASGERAMGALSFTAGLSRDVAPTVRVHASVGSAFETPTTTELATPGSGGLDRDLAPQRTLQWEVGLRARGARLEAGVAIYQAAVRDGLLPYEAAAAPGRFLYRNTGRSRHRGAEVDLKASLPSGLRLAVAYALTEHRFVEFPTDSTPLDGRYVPGVPRSTAYAALSAGTGDGGWADLEVAQAGTAYADDANGLRAAPWWVLNLRAGWVRRAGARRLAPFVGVNNLLDRRYAAALTVNARAVSGAGRRAFEPAPGRNYYVGFEVSGER